ncbi:hypothetical protein AMJ80_10115 [bacterium SM23_31]|nr:MAG: hypothetical protein AMJ80_10115 [bacterium SM23_31]
MKNHSICEKFQVKLHEYLDNELSAEEAGLVKQHLRICIGCRLELEKIRKVDSIGTADVFPDPGNEFWINQRRRIGTAIGAAEPASYPPAAPHTEHWTLKPFKSFGWRTAVGLSAAAVLILFVMSAVDRLDFFRQWTGQNVSGVTESIGDTGKSDKSKLAEETIGKTTDKPPLTAGEQAAIQTPEQQKAQMKSTGKIDITDEKIAKTSDVQAGSKNEKGIKITIPSIEGFAAKQKTDTKSMTALNQKTDLRNPPIPLTTAEKDLRTVTAIEGLRISKNVDQEFETYIANQALINALKDPVEQKNQWLIYLPTVKGKEVQDLVIYELYNIYYKIVNPDSPKELKKEALDFVIKYEKSLITILGEPLYEKRLLYFKKMLNPGAY